MKKLLSMLIASCLCLSSIGVKAYATSTVSESFEIASNSVQLVAVDKRNAEKLLTEIPVFITTISDESILEMEMIRNSVKEVISLQVNEKSRITQNDSGSFLVSETQNYQIEELTNTAKNSIIDNVMFANTIRWITEIAESGVNVTSLNILTNPYRSDLYIIS